MGENSQAVFWDPPSPTAILKCQSIPQPVTWLGAAGATRPIPGFCYLPLLRALCFYTTSPAGITPLIYTRKVPSNLHQEGGRGPG